MMPAAIPVAILVEKVKAKAVNFWSLHAHPQIHSHKMS